MFLTIILITLFVIVFIAASFEGFVLFGLRTRGGWSGWSVCFGVIGVSGYGSFVVLRWRFLLFFIFIVNFSFILRYFWPFLVQYSHPKFFV